MLQGPARRHGWRLGGVAAWLTACGGSTSAIHAPSDSGISDVRTIDATVATPDAGGTSETGTTRTDAMASDATIWIDAATHLVYCPSGPRFNKLSPVDLGNAPYVARVGDFNGDGHIDVAVPDYGDNNLNVLFGDGTGSLTQAPGSPYAVGGAPCSEAIADFDGDGLADIAVMNSGPGTISIMLGRAVGSLVQAPGSPFAVGAQSSQSCGPATGTFNRGGATDLVVPVDNSLQMLLGDGHGRLTAGQSTMAAGTLKSAVVADFNEDGLVDVAATDFGAQAVDIFLGDGHGGLMSAAGSPWPIGAEAVSAATGDFNGDGHVDLAVAGYDAGNVSILLGDGKGGFAKAAGSPVFVGTNPTDVTTGDFDGDGNLDLVVAVNGDSSIAILRGSGTGAFSSAAGSPMKVGPYPGSVATGDFNEDGRLDVALTNNIPGTWTVSILLNSCRP